MAASGEPRAARASSKKVRGAAETGRSPRTSITKSGTRKRKDRYLETKMC